MLCIKAKEKLGIIPCLRKLLSFLFLIILCLSGCTSTNDSLYETRKLEVGESISAAIESPHVFPKIKENESSRQEEFVLKISKGDNNESEITVSIDEKKEKFYLVCAHLDSHKKLGMNFPVALQK